MFERYSSKKNLDVAYQGDFEDTAWTKFSEAQLPPPRMTLEDFAKYPFVAGEITSKSDYVRHVVTWFSKALIDAGYKENEVDGLIAKSLDVIDFNRPASAYVADINRVIQNFYKAAPGKNSLSTQKLPRSNSAATQNYEEKTVANSLTTDGKPPILKIPAVDTTIEMTTLSQEEGSIRPSGDTMLNALEIKTDTPNPHSTSSIENIHEAENLSLATELDKLESEQAEYGTRTMVPSRLSPPAVTAGTETQIAVKENKTIDPLVLKDKLPEKLVLTKEQILPNPLVLAKTQILPETLVLTPEMPVIDVDEPLVLESVEEKNESLSERSNYALEYQTKLDALGVQPFNHEAYIEYVFDVHAGLRQEYDGVITSARGNLKRFDGFYAPSTIEKKALQLLSSLQGQYAKMQNPDSDIGIIRGALTEKLSEHPTGAVESEIKVLTQNYLDATKKLFANIRKLEDLIEEVKLEEKPKVAEVYRAQFEKMQTEGDQVLRSLPVSHPLYERLKTAIESDLVDLIKNAAIENGGDLAVLENSANFIARRDHIKNLISFVKEEQELQDYFKRARTRIQKLESQFEVIPATEKGREVKIIIAENIVKIKQALEETVSQIATVGVIENLQKQKGSIEMLLRDSEESLLSLPIDNNVVELSAGAKILTDAEVMERIKKSVRGREIIAAQERYGERALLLPYFEEWKDAVRRREQRALEAGANLERDKALASKVPLGKIGKIAAVLIALASPAGVTNQKSNFSVVGSLGMPAGVVSLPNVEYVDISEFLRTADGARSTMSEVTTSLRTPVAETMAPELPHIQKTLETVPGVVLPNTVSSVDINRVDTLPDYYSDDADVVPADPGIVFESPKNNNLPEVLRTPYKINIGDTFWDINEGQTLAGKLPAMSQINPYFKQALVDRIRDQINAEPALRTQIGGFGSNANQLRAGELMNLNKLNDLAVRLAVEYGYLK